MINEGEHEYLRLSTPLFIGGLPSEAAEKAARQWQLRNTTSFRGCVRGISLVVFRYLSVSTVPAPFLLFFFCFVLLPIELWINGKLTDYAQAASKQHRIVPGCANSDNEEAAVETKKPKSSSIFSGSSGFAKKESGLRNELDSATQPQGYVMLFIIIIMIIIIF